MEEVPADLSNRTEALFRETEVGSIAESKRTTTLVEELRAKSEAVGEDKLREVAEKLLERTNATRSA